MDDRRHLTLRIPLPRRRDVARTVVALGVAGLPVLRAWGLQWGAREEELEAHLPGDCLAPDADLVATRAIGLAAPPQDVWPWVVQVGRGRCGSSPDDTLEVAAVDAGRALVLRSPGGAAAPYRLTWAFVVRPDGRGGTRLVVRERYAYRTAWARFAAEPACAVSAVTTRSLLRGVRRRVRGASNVIRPAG